MNRPRIHVIGDDNAAPGIAKRSLSKHVDVVTSRDPFEALVAIGSDKPDGVVLDLEMRVVACQLNAHGGLVHPSCSLASRARRPHVSTP